METLTYLNVLEEEEEINLENEPNELQEQSDLFVSFTWKYQFMEPLIRKGQ